MTTLNSILNDAAIGMDFYILLGDFLDEFYRAEQETRQAMISERPSVQDTPKEYLSFAASVAHKLANEYKLNVPKWVFEPSCYLPGKQPFFGCNAKGKLRLLFMYTSPAEFKHRNLFVDENVLARV